MPKAPFEEMNMRSDSDIRRDTESELTWDPSIDDKTIGVIVHDGVVTLTGESAHYAGRWAAEDAAKRVKGVRAIANEIQVKLPVAGVRSDADIAEAAANALQWNVVTSAAAVKPIVKDGWVTLSGKVSWGYQKLAAEISVRNLQGVNGVINNIGVDRAVNATDVKQKIEEAFKRHAILDASEIQVKVHDSTVTLKGHVRTWQERDDAMRAAWSAPGVANVENQLYLVS
jgi:osmotically-inducible protein OsmY